MLKEGKLEVLVVVKEEVNYNWTFLFERVRVTDP